MLHHLANLFLLSLLLACSAKTTSSSVSSTPIVPAPWDTLVPVDGLKEVRTKTSENAFVADYTGSTAEQLLARVERSFVGAGYERTCTQLEGRVRGYSKGQQKFLVKVDSLGPVQGLLISNERGPEPLLYGVCFKGYQMRPVDPSRRGRGAG